MLRLITLILGIAAIEARIFNNPILDSEDYNSPSGIKVNGTYYIITGNLLDIQTEKIQAIHVSTDLINWKPAGYVFNKTNYPLWANKDHTLRCAKIHEIDGNYYIYFNGYYNATDGYAIGVAVAPHPLGPYIAKDQPLWANRTRGPYYPTIASDNGNLYLISSIEGIIYGRQLNSDGVSFASDKITELIRPILVWEYYFVDAPWHIRRGDFHYIMYSAGSGSESQGIGVERSRNVLGPYEKLAEPILVSNNEFKNPIFNSGFKDLDDQNEVIVFQCYNASAGPNSDQVINLASIGWHASGWPYIYDY